ncbi:MAG: hypothetical protein JO025_15910 [Verrucomicrobia bacterium]|nr:hypothetical protein [Verrucomicrobiota bacterium]
MIQYRQMTLPSSSELTGLRRTDVEPLVECCDVTTRDDATTRRERLGELLGVMHFVTDQPGIPC